MLYNSIKLYHFFLYFFKAYLGFYFYHNLDFLSRLDILGKFCQIFYHIAYLSIRCFLDFPTLIWYVFWLSFDTQGQVFFDYLTEISSFVNFSLSFIGKIWKNVIIFFGFRLSSTFFDKSILTYHVTFLQY